MKVIKTYELQGVTNKVHRNLLDKLEIDESVHLIQSLKNKEYVICTELRIIRCSKDAAVKWEISYMKDVIVSAKIEGNKIHVKEFEDRAEYWLDLETGEVIR
jgi:hypothetical protein